jgi:hypothetical protein
MGRVAYKLGLIAAAGFADVTTRLSGLVAGRPFLQQQVFALVDESLRKVRSASQIP